MSYVWLGSTSTSGRCGDRPSPAPTGFHVSPIRPVGRHRPRRRALRLPVIGRLMAARSRAHQTWPPLRAAS
jgi:hypothetical protein